jgi:formylglycine-generating enzyme required for sulfatase activity
MGSPADEVGRHDNEVQREVTLTRAFLIQTTEVTQGQFRDVMGYDPSEFARCGRDCPVEQVSWHDAAAYCNAISDQEGLGRCYSCRGEEISVFCTPSTAYATPYDCPGYRLPTEAEWELAARAGRATALYGELAAIAWYAGNSDASYAGAFDCSDGGGGVREAATCGPHPVGLKRRNECGLHDVLGNVWEWCHDFYAEGRAESAATDPVGPGPAIARVFRGGSWDNDAGSLRLARRNGGAPGTRFVDVGVRSARTAPRR